LHSRDDERKEYLSKIQLLSDELDLVTQEHAKLKHSGDLASDVDRMQAVSPPGPFDRVLPTHSRHLQYHPSQERDRAEAELEQVTLECNQLRELVDELESRVAGHEDDLARVADEWQAEVTDREQQLEEALERVKAAERELADKDADVVGTNKDLKAVRSSVISDDGRTSG
jgi:C4-dicarboxylate-specific signal transduction histidine kinase